MPVTPPLPLCARLPEQLSAPSPNTRPGSKPAEPGLCGCRPGKEAEQEAPAAWQPPPLPCRRRRSQPAATAGSPRSGSACRQHLHGITGGICRVISTALCGELNCHGKIDQWMLFNQERGTEESLSVKTEAKEES
nr:uncharacterized protein LOC125630234 isoform X2 [Caretta caretta]